MATAVIVTRISSNYDLSNQISNEVGITKAWLPAAGVLLLIGFILACLIYYLYFLVF